MHETTDYDQANAVAKIPSGVAVLTAGDAGASTGMLASWMQQAAFEPLMVTVCVKAGRPIEALVAASRGFVLNVLGENPADMFKHFGRGFAPGEDAFVGVASRTTVRGVVLDDAVAVIECELVATQPAGDHVLYLGRVVKGRADRDAPPHVHLRKNGLSYGRMKLRGG